jgi:repressor LexA
MDDMAPVQKEVFQAIKDYIAEKGYSPSIRDIASKLGLHHSTIEQHFRILRNKGFITWDSHIARSIRPVTRAAIPCRNK